MVSHYPSVEMVLGEGTRHCTSSVPQFHKPPVCCSESSPQHAKSVNVFTHGCRLFKERDLKVCPSVRPGLLLLR